MNLFFFSSSFVDFWRTEGQKDVNNQMIMTTKKKSQIEKKLEVHLSTLYELIEKLTNYYYYYYKVCLWLRGGGELYIYI
jgi:hypothetical protein